MPQPIDPFYEDAKRAFVLATDYEARVAALEAERARLREALIQQMQLIQAQTNADEWPGSKAARQALNPTPAGILSRLFAVLILVVAIPAAHSSASEVGWRALYSSANLLACSISAGVNGLVSM